jgi:RES domain-containing protein
VSAAAAKDFRLNDTHRLIPSKYSESGTVLSRLATRDSELHELMELDSATNDRLKGEEGLLPGISVQELVYGVRYAHIVNAAFTHASPAGGRFNDNTRGAWYAALERETSLVEVAFHKLNQLAEVDWQREEVSTYDEFLADFTTEFQDLRVARPGYKKYLRPGPLPACYLEPQRFAAALLEERSNGIIYPSVRREGGICVVCFRPALVYNVRQNARLEVKLQVGRSFDPEEAREVRIQ